MKLKLLAQATAVLGALALLLMATNTDSVDAQAKFEPTFTFQITDTAPDATPDTILDLNIPTGDVNFAGAVAYIPNDWGVVTGDTLPIGSQVGYLSSVAVLGLIGSACNQPLEPDFDLLNASIDINDTVSFEDLDDNGTRDYADDADDDGVFNAIEKYPEFITRLFEAEDNPDYPLQPIRRSAAITPVAGIPVLLQFLIFPPGTLIDKDIPNDPGSGFPVRHAPPERRRPRCEPGAGSDHGLLLPTDITQRDLWCHQGQHRRRSTSDEAGYTVQINPSDGKYVFTGLAFGQRDADGDTFENSLDTCPYVANVGDPRITNSGDLDADGLDAACDPNDDPATGGTNSDQDGDGYLNRQDNCPLISNGQDTTNQNDNDSDQIGDVCDTSPGVEGDNSTADGDLIPYQTTFEASIGTGAGPNGPPTEAACTGTFGEQTGEDICWQEGWTPPAAAVAHSRPQPLRRLRRLKTVTAAVASAPPPSSASSPQSPPVSP